MSNVAPYEILTGVGELYLAPVGKTMPEVDAAPGASWISLGDTQDGVTVTADQDIEEIRVDQETGPVKATRTEESLVLETKLAAMTLENLAYVLGNTVTDTPAASGVIGTREVGMYRGQSVSTYAFLFRGTSAYGDYPAQYQVPMGYFGGAMEAEYTKDGNAAIPCEFHALVDPNAATAAERFGVLVMQDAAALP